MKPRLRKIGLGPRFTATLAVFLAVAALLLVYEHRAHIFTGTGLLVALLALCVGMFFFLHGHRGEDEDESHKSGSDAQSQDRAHE